MAELATIVTVLSAVSTVVSFAGKMQQASAQEDAAQAQLQAAEHQRVLDERQAELFESQAGQERAVSQRAAIEDRRQGQRISSRAQALAGASGAGALDPTIVGILGDIDFETELRAGTSLAAGEQAGRDLDYRGVLTRAGGDADLFAGQAAARATQQAASRSRLEAFGTLLEGGTSLYEKYADEPPPTSPTRPPPGPQRFRYG